MIRTENDFTVARAELNQAMGVAGDTDYDVADDDFPPVPGETGPVGPLIDEAIRARPDLAALDRQVQRAGAGGARRPRRLLALAQPDRGRPRRGQSIEQTRSVDNLGNPDH